MIASVTGITGTQIKDARKLLGWSMATLAKKAERSYGMIAKAESSTLPPQHRDATVAAIKGALEAAGVEFLNHGQPGVRLIPEKAMAHALRKHLKAEEAHNVRDAPEPGATTDSRRGRPGQDRFLDDIDRIHGKPDEEA